jgi:hypothetical protein
MGADVSHDAMKTTAADSQAAETQAIRATSTRAGLDVPALLCVSLVALMSVGMFGLAMAPRNAEAIPSFARQTGQPCASCHTSFPQLTPFGRRFKLGGYTMGGGMTFEEAPPIAAMVIPTFAKTAVRQDSPPTNPNGFPIAHTNDNFVLQQASLFYGGTVYGNLGAFVQATYDKAAQHTFLDNTDIRYADTTKLFGIDVLYGLDVNNGPSVQDVWNTTPAWGYPFLSSTLAPQFKPPGTIIEGSFAGRSAGTGGYLFLNDAIYLEVAGYHNLSKGELNALGQPCANNADYVAAVASQQAAVYPPGVTYTTPCSQASLNGAAPYWRVAIEPNFGDHSFMIGAFAFYPEVLPGRIMGYGVDRYRDIGFDAQYQWLSDPHAITLRFSRISEQQQLTSTYLQGVVNGLGILPFATGNGPSTNISNRLTSLKASASYTWDRTISGTVGYFNVWGTQDDLLYGNALTNPVGPSAFGSPDGKGLTFELAYMPFSKGGPSFYPWANAKFGVSYTHYLKLYGGTTNFDGLGPYFNGSVWRTHNASDNDTLFLYSWIAF